MSHNNTDLSDDVKKLVSLIDDIISPTDQSIKLYDVSDLAAFEDNYDAYSLLTHLIKKKQRRYAWMATFFNAIFTQRVDSFMFSRRIMLELLKQDKSHKFNTCHNDHYRPFIADLTNTSSIVEVIQLPVGMTAGFYRLNKKNPAYSILCQLISKDYLSASFEQRYKWFCDNIQGSKLTEEERAFMKKAKEDREASRGVE